jgi:hypothetical protein
VRLSEFVTEINLDPDADYRGAYFKFQTSQEDYMNKLVPKFDPHSDPLSLPEAVWIQARFRTWDEATKMEIVDEFWLEVRGSSETFTDFCDYSSLSIKAGSQMSGARTIDIVSDASRTDWDPERIYISTEIEGLAELRELQGPCAEGIFMTIEAKQASGAYEQIWSSQTGSTQQWLWVDMQPNDVNWINVSLSRWSFVNELQWTYATNARSFPIPMTVTWRDATGEPLLSEGFSIKLNDVSQEESPCKDFTVRSETKTRDYMFAVDAWKYEEMYMDTAAGSDYSARQ